MENQPKKAIVKWADIDTMCKDIVSQLRGQYDVIIPIARGGLVPGTIIANLLGVTNVAPIQWQTRDGGHRDFDRLLNIVSNTEYKRILIVDDILDSGKCLAEISDAVSEFCQSQPKITFAVLIKNVSYEHHRDEMINMVYANRFDKRTDNSWIYWPWELPPVF